LGVVTVIVQAILLFIVIPEFSNRLTPFYNQDKSPDGYDILATNLAEGNGYRFYPETAKTLMREPGYPVLLAGFFLVFGHTFAVVKLTNMFLALTTAWLMTLVARRLASSRLLILGSPLLFLFHPGTLIAESRGGVEILFTLFIVLFMLTLYRSTENNRSWDYVLSGGVLGLAVLIKSTPLLFPLFLLAYLLVFERRVNPKATICRNISLMVMAMFVVLSPWIIRNYLLTGKFVPTASILGVSAQAGQYIGTHLSRDNRWVDLDREAARERNKLAQELGYPFKDGYYQSFYYSQDEVKFYNYLLKRVIGEYQRSPALFLRCVSSNLFNFWFAGKTWKSTILNVIVQLPVLILASAGAVLSVRNGRGKIIATLVLFVIYIVAVSLPILAQARYSVPVIPFLSILACVTLAAAHRRLTGCYKAVEPGT